MYPQEPRQPRLPIIPIIIAVVVLALAGGIWFAATHGRVVTSGAPNLEGQYTLQKSDTDDSEETTIEREGSTTVRSGAYTLRYKDGQSESMKYINVPTFLRSVVASFANTGPRKIERLAIGVLDYVADGPNNTYTSVNTQRDIGSAFSHPYDDPTGIAKSVMQLPISGGQNFVNNNYFVGFTSATDDGKMQLQRYNFKTTQNEILPKRYSSRGATTSLVFPTTAQNNTYGVLYEKDKNSAVDIYDGNNLSSTLDNLKSVALGRDGGRVISVSNKYLAYGTGNSYSGRVDEDLEDVHGETPKLNDFIIKVYDLSTKAIVKELNLGKINTVGDIQINNDGTYVSVVQEGQIKIYDIASSRQVFAFSSSSIISPKWVSGSQLIFGSVEDGLFRLDAEERTASSIFTAGTLNLSTFDVHDNKIYFTAFSKNPNASAGAADGFVAYLDQEAKNNNQLITKTPGKNSQVRIQALHNTIFVAPNTFNYGGGLDSQPIVPDDLFEAQAQAYLNNTFVNYKQYTIRYFNFF